MVNLHHIYREGNSVSDSLAKQELKFRQGSVQLWMTPPEDTKMLLPHAPLDALWLEE